MNFAATDPMGILLLAVQPQMASNRDSFLSLVPKHVYCHSYLTFEESARN